MNRALVQRSLALTCLPPVGASPGLNRLVGLEEALANNIFEEAPVMGRRGLFVPGVSRLLG